MEPRRLADRTTTSGRTHSGGPHISLERRLNPRRPAVDHRVWVGGWGPGGEFAAVAARIEDISRGGVRLMIPISFEEGDEVWLKLANPSYAGCVRAVVLQSTETPAGDHVARLRFPEECPEAFFRLVTRSLRG